MLNQEEQSVEVQPQPVKTQTTSKDVVKPTWYWIKDSNGQGSASVTFAFVAFWVTTLAYVLSIFEKIGPLPIRPFDATACGAYMTPIMALYWGRRWTDAKSK